MNKRNRRIFIFVSIFFFVGLLLGLFLFSYPNTKSKTYYVHVPIDADFPQLMDSLRAKQVLRNEFSFRVVVKLMRYKTVHPGKYRIDANENNRSLIQKLRKGQHYSVKFTFNNIRTKDQFVGKVGYKFLFAPEELRALLDDNTFLKQYGLTQENVIGVFIPDSYEFFYDIAAEDFFEKLYGYYERFWTQERINLAREIGLTPMEVVTLASIVEEENFKGDEKSMIAGVYVNRLKKGMKLQADPTVKYAIGDFSRQRIYFKDLEIDSPYNTYKYAGLPPGPIRIPEASTIDAVLHYTKHNYLYMCAKADLSGRHEFAVTLAEHERNAKKYRQALERLEIRK